jgi:hypothetical protein
MEKD